MSEALVNNLAKQIASGCVSVSALITKNGIHRNTAMLWRNYGNKLLEMHDNDREKTLEYIETLPKSARKYAVGCVKFVTDIPAALAILQMNLEEVVITEGLRDPKMALNILERIAPNDWARRVRLDGRIEEHKTVTQIVIHSGQEEVKQIAEPTATDAEFEDV